MRIISLSDYLLAILDEYAPVGLAVEHAALQVEVTADAVGIDSLDDGLDAVAFGKGDVTFVVHFIAIAILAGVGALLVELLQHCLVSPGLSGSTHTWCRMTVSLLANG